MSIAFSTKGSTLVTLKEVLKSARIAPLTIITVDEWQADKKSCSDKIVKYLGSGPLIVRSSSSQEDTGRFSNAGAFLSISDVSAEELPDAVDRVIESYGEASPKDEVLIQPKLTDILRSGGCLLP